MHSPKSVILCIVLLPPGTIGSFRGGETGTWQCGGRGRHHPVILQWWQFRDCEGELALGVSSVQGHAILLSKWGCSFQTLSS